MTATIDYVGYLAQGYWLIGLLIALLIMTMGWKFGGSSKLEIYLLGSLVAMVSFVGALYYPTWGQFVNASVMPFIALIAAALAMASAIYIKKKQTKYAAVAGCLIVCGLMVYLMTTGYNLALVA